jgi:hypothetical protein
MVHARFELLNAVDERLEVRDGADEDLELEILARVGRAPSSVFCGNELAQLCEGVIDPLPALLPAKVAPSQA